jgi:glycosyltransferase involved in cell wall biosynthesis
MKILFLPKYNEAGASSRYRTHQFLPYFRERGFQCDVLPFFDEKHISDINQSKRSTKISYIEAIFGRISLIYKAGKYDLLFIEKELIPYFPPIIENLLLRQKVKYILDFDDAIFHNYDLHKSSLVRTFLGSKVPNIVSNASAIVTGSNYLYQFCKQYNANVYLIPTVVNLDKYPIKKDKAAAKVVGWIGSFYTSDYLKVTFEALERVLPEQEALLNLIGFNRASLPAVLKPYTNVISWNQQNEVEEIRKFAVGISPLIDSPFARGKCAFKSIQYMACGKPVVTSPVGANGELVKHKQNGFHANTSNDWYKYLSMLLNDSALASAIGEKNRKAVEDHYSLQHVLERYLTIFENSLN